MKKTKVSNHQIFALAANCTIGTTLISVASGVASFAKQDAWIAALIAPVLGLPFIWIYYKLGKLFPGKTLIEMFNMAFGKWVGWIVSAFFILFVCFLDVEQLLFYIGDFMSTEYMTETPLYAFNLLLAFSMAIALLYGLETIARSAEVFAFVAVSLITLIFVLNLTNVNVEYLLPVFENGLAPILKGSLHLSSYLTWPFVILLMIYPASSDNSKKTRNALFAGYILGAVISLIATLMSILVLGSAMTAKSQYPIYIMAKQIDIGVIERIEGVISFSWILTAFIKTLLYFYAGIVGISQLFKIEQHKRLILPLTLVILIFSGIVYPDSSYETKWDSTTWIPFIGTFGAILPSLMLIIAKYKKRQISS